MGPGALCGFTGPTRDIHPVLFSLDLGPGQIPIDSLHFFYKLHCHELMGLPLLPCRILIQHLLADLVFALL